MNENQNPVLILFLFVSNWQITMDDIFDNILNSKNRDNEKREREDILEDKERKRVDIEEE